MFALKTKVLEIQQLGQPEASGEAQSIRAADVKAKTWQQKSGVGFRA